MHPFKGHLSREKAISLTRKCNFLVDVFFQVNNIPAIAGVSSSFDVSLHCTMHPSGLRSLVKRYPLTPSAFWRTRKLSVPCCVQEVFSDFVVVSQHRVAHNMGSKDADNCIMGGTDYQSEYWVRQHRIRFTVPASLNYDANNFSGINGTWSLIT
jgi:hypothetical protein